MWGIPGKNGGKKPNPRSRSDSVHCLHGFLTFPKQALVFTCLQYKSCENTVFYPFEELSSIFIKFEIVVCKLIQFGRV